MTCYLHMPARPPALLPHLLPQAARGSSSSFTSDRGVLEWGKSQPRDKRPLASRHAIPHLLSQEHLLVLIFPRCTWTRLKNLFNKLPPLHDLTIAADNLRLLQGLFTII